VYASAPRPRSLPLERYATAGLAISAGHRTRQQLTGSTLRSAGASASSVTSASFSNPGIPERGTCIPGLRRIEPLTRMRIRNSY